MYNAKDKIDKGEWYYKFDYIDLDPFGGCIPFLDSAIRAIKNDGFFFKKDKIMFMHIYI